MDSTKEFMKIIEEELTGIHLKIHLNHDCLVIKPVNDWIDEAKSREVPKMLFSEFWFENELCILYADTNLGKSVLAVQIADSISTGVAIDGFKLEILPTKVAYFDFELSDKQLEKRYSNNYKNHYEFNKNFLRAEINPEQIMPEKFGSFDEFLCDSIEKIVQVGDIKILIIDNLTYLRTDTEKAKDALQLMKLLNQLKKKYLLSILIIAHTPKRDSTKPLSKNDLSGSKMLMNFCDSSFAIGESFQEKGYRYLKQIKQRNTEHIYDTNNVILCKMENNSNFLGFEFKGFGTEYEHLRANTENKSAGRIEMIKELKNEGLSNVKIGERLNISEGTVRNSLKS
jgi:hypothetical protein